MYYTHVIIPTTCLNFKLKQQFVNLFFSHLYIQRWDINLQSFLMLYNTTIISQTSSNCYCLVLLSITNITFLFCIFMCMCTPTSGWKSEFIWSFPGMWNVQMPWTWISNHMLVLLYGYACIRVPYIFPIV